MIGFGDETIRHNAEGVKEYRRQVYIGSKQTGFVVAGMVTTSDPAANRFDAWCPSGFYRGWGRSWKNAAERLR